MARKRPALKRLRDWLVYQCARLLLFLGRGLPDGLGYALGGAFGSLIWRFSRRDRTRALENIRRAYDGQLSEEEIEKIARGSFRHLGRIAFELPRIPALNLKRVESNVSIEGLEILREGVAAGRGVVIATGHIGNWEVMGAAASRLGLPLNVIARRINDPRLNDLVIRLRGRSGVKTILRESAESAKRILGCLRRGEMLALLIDQDIQVEGAFVPFFGRDAWTPIGAAALAVRTGALLVAVATHRISPGRHQVHVRVVDIPNDPERAIIEATRLATAHLEYWIRQRPEQWAWIHDRWRTRPQSTAE